MGIPLTAAATEQAKNEIESGKFLFKLSIEFGPEFHQGHTLTRKQLLGRLKEEAAKHDNFSAHIFNHVAEHMELDHLVRDVADETAPMTFLSGYRGCGSCNAGPGNMGQVCSWPDGTSSCEIC